MSDEVRCEPVLHIRCQHTHMRASRQDKIASHIHTHKHTGLMPPDALRLYCSCVYCCLRDGTITYGGYSTYVLVDEDFVLRIPDGVNFADAAPLLCAGITVSAAHT